MVEVVEESASRNDERRKETTVEKEEERQKQREREKESWIRGRIGERPLVR